MQQQESFTQKAISISDSAATYCAGGGLTALSCVADQLNPIMQFLGLLIGGVVCLAKGYYDWKKHKGKMGKPVNDR